MISIYKIYIIFSKFPSLFYNHHNQHSHYKETHTYSQNLSNSVQEKDFYTDFQNYFISVSLGEIVLDKEKFITISTSTPLFQALSGKIKGDTFKFRDQIYTITDVF